MLMFIVCGMGNVKNQYSAYHTIRAYHLKKEFGMILMLPY